MILDELIDSLRHCGGGTEGIKLVNEAADTIEKLSAENKQIRTELIMQTALAQSGKYAIDRNRKIEIKYHTLLKDFKELGLNHRDLCDYCKHNQICYGKECDLYIDGTEAWDHKGCKHDWVWSCKDFTFGTCPKLENTPCNGCIKNNMRGFEYKGGDLSDLV